LADKTIWLFRTFPDQYPYAADFPKQSLVDYSTMQFVMEFRGHPGSLLDLNAPIMP
jgi:hypothetical protein